MDTAVCMKACAMKFVQVVYDMFVYMCLFENRKQKCITENPFNCLIFMLQSVFPIIAQEHAIKCS